MFWKTQAGPSPDDPRIGGMATIPSRAHSLPAALDTIVGQVDTLYLYLDKHDAVPPVLARYPNIVPLLPTDFGHHGGSGKFLGVRLCKRPSFYCCFDDDILYAPSYAEKLVRGVVRYRGRAVVGIHGTVFRAPYRSYKRDRWGTNFKRRLLFNTRVDELGTGTVGFHTSFLSFDVKDWPYDHMADLDLALEADRRGLPLIALRRRKRFLRAIEEGQDDSLYRRLVDDESIETARMRERLKARVTAAG
jgi:hypothetical protein